MKRKKTTVEKTEKKPSLDAGGCARLGMTILTGLGDSLGLSNTRFPDDD